MQLETPRLYLRPVMASDVDDLFRIYGDPATQAFNPAGPYPDINYAYDTLAQWIKHWDDYSFGNLAISLKDNPKRIIGFGGLSTHKFSDLFINNLGYRFSTEAWGKGLATEFANHEVNYGFCALKLLEISAVVRANHVISQKVLMKCGLKYIRDIYDVKNAPASMLFSLRRDQWEKNSK